ncbi:MAG: helix-turn-helix domain-containing protein [Deltaproteobacteria bacterium]|nr:helix-turn-helix domain-containing protein [Deltaproteobacteria bacterium]
MKRFLEQNFYDLLEISPSATPEEILRAYERARTLYGPGSLAAYALLSPEEAATLARRIEEAGDVLIDPETRASYDARLPAEEVRPARPPPEPPTPPPPPPPAPPPAPSEAMERPFVPPEGAVWTGELLRQAREARGLTVPQLAERTKVSRLHIECVEGDRFDQLPVQVYLRGIVMCLARELRLDGQKVARSYLERVAGAPKTGR